MNAWVDQWLAELEQNETDHRLNLNRLQADQCLKKIGELEGKLADVEKLAGEELILVERYRQQESDRINRQIRWLALQVECFMREHNKATGDKSLTLPFGQLKLRQQRDKVVVENAELAMQAAMKQGLVRVVPESFEIDATKLLRHTKTTGEIILGTKLVEGDTKFSYITIKGGNDVEQRESSQTGTESGTERESDVVEESNTR